MIAAAGGPPRPPTAVWALLPVTVAVMIVAAIWVRYPMPWAESDTVAVTRTIRGVLAQETVEPGALAYSNGFNYPTFAAIVVQVTGLPTRVVQTLLLPWLLPVTALIAFIAFRTMTGSGPAGAMCALLLLIQADFLFVTQRGSHEKITWALVLLMVFALIRSATARGVGAASPFVAVMYLCGFTIVCTNVFFASSLITVYLLSFLAGAVVAFRFFRDREGRRILLRLAYVFVTLGVLAYLFMVSIYPPARSNLETLQGAADQVAVLYLGVETAPATAGDTEEALIAEAAATSPLAPAEPEVLEPQPVSPYREIGSTWVSQNVFILVTGFTWILLLYAGIGWVVVSLRFLKRGVSREEMPLFIAWAFAAATALQIAASVAADFAGVLGGNLQLRLFPAFTLFAIPLVVTTLRLPSSPPRRGRLRRLAPAAGLVALAAAAVAVPLYTLIATPVVLVALQYGSLGRWPITLRQIVAGVAALAFAGFAAAATLKATNDPLISNRWTFYSQSEARALRWGNRHLSGELIWSEYDERLKNALVLIAEDDAPDDEFGVGLVAGGGVIDESRYVLVSDVTTERALRVAQAVPDVHREDLVYDNGAVQVAHWLPTTPFQP